jgi:DNA-directed RNA polymerase subunit RPC12/RpoP
MTMKVQSTSADQFPSVRMFCPDCGGAACITALSPLMFAPSVDEVTYRCSTCGGETKVQLEAGLAGAAS